MGRIRANIELDEESLRRIMDRYGVSTRTEAVDLALRHLAGQAMTRADALAMRGMVDCMIAAVAWRTRASILAADADLAGWPA